MDIGVISVRYARALLKSSTDAKIEDSVYKDMQVLAKSYIDVPELRFTIDNPMLSKDSKETLLVTAAGSDVCELTNDTHSPIGHIRWHVYECKPFF